MKKSAIQFPVCVINNTRFYSLVHLQTKTTRSPNYCCCFVVVVVVVVVFVDDDFWILAYCSRIVSNFLVSINFLITYQSLSPNFPRFCEISKLQISTKKKKTRNETQYCGRMLNYSARSYSQSSHFALIKFFFIIFFFHSLRF